MSERYDKAKARLRAVGVNVYVVNEKNPRLGYRRQWKIHVPHDPRSPYWTDDTWMALCFQLERLADDHEARHSAPQTGDGE